MLGLSGLLILIGFIQLTLFGLPSAIAVGASHSIPRASETDRLKVIVLTVGASKIEFGKYLKSNGKHSEGRQVAVSEYVLARLNPEERLRNLTSQYVIAKSHYLGGSREAAKHAYLSAVLQTPEADWNLPQRRIIYESYLRLAELSDVHQESQEWIEKAVSFGADLVADPQVFSPAILSRVHEITQKLDGKSLRWNVGQYSKYFYKLLVDGRSTELFEHTWLQMLPGHHRVTLLSDTHLPIQMVRSSSEIVAMEFNPSPIVGGNCAQPTLLLDQETIDENFPNGFDAFYSESCIITYKDKVWTANSKISKVENTELNHKPEKKWGALGHPTKPEEAELPKKNVSSLAHHNNRFLSNETTNMEKSPEDSRDQGVFSLDGRLDPSHFDRDLADNPAESIWAKPQFKTWFWVGVGAVVTGSIWFIVQNHNRGSKTEPIAPTHFDGM